LTLEDAAAVLECSAATMSRIENSVRVPRARDVRDLCRLYGADQAATTRLTGLVEAAREPGWWEAYTEVDEDYATYIGFESAAVSIRQYEGTVIPGMLQIPDYIRGYLRDAISPGRMRSFSEHDIEKGVEVRLKRQQILEGTSPLNYTAIMDEGTLRRPVGGVTAMRAQLLHLAKVAEKSNITVKILPFGIGGHAGQPGSFTIISLQREGLSDVVHVESLAGQIFLETDEELLRHRRVFDQLDAAALDQTKSQEAFRKIAEGL
jgi:transcriptional regulator with XRE-family HTH domain